MPSVPLRNAYARPPEGIWSELPESLQKAKEPKSQRAKLASLLESEPSDGTERPFQEAEWNPRGGE